MPERPRGVTALALAYVAFGIAIVLLTLYAIFVLGTIPRALEAFVYFPEVLVWIAVALAAVFMAVAYGLLALHPWARGVVVWFSLIGVLLGFLALPLGLVSIFLNLGTVWYVSDERVRSAFRRDERRPPFTEE